jgi:peptidoglycan hydrolase-like protein with peptidoglycan-binding domain
MLELADTAVNFIEIEDSTIVFTIERSDPLDRIATTVAIFSYSSQKIDIDTSILILEVSQRMNDIQKLKPNERPVLKQGSDNDWNIFVQDGLNGCGYGPLNLDGDFGTQTLAEVKRFQQDLGLAVNGTVDVATWTALDNHQKQFGWQAEWPSALSLTGIGGTDTLTNVEANMIPAAKQLMGTSPRFWGRYFQGNSRDGEYLHNQEDKPLHNAGIRVLPISRQTNRVNGTQQDGMVLGTSHANDVLVTFGEDYLAAQGNSFYIFLDVEGVGSQPSLSKEFYQGWSKAVTQASIKVKLLPSVYLNGSDKTTLRNLSTAIKEASPCLGIWLARYVSNPLIKPWNREGVKLNPAVPCKVLIHQYIGDVDPGTGKVNPSNGVYDFNQINPFLDNPESVLQRMILPPS